MEKRKINYFIATITLYAVCLLGQILCDGLGYDHVLGKYLFNSVIFCAVCIGVYFLVHFLQKTGKVRRILSWIFGLLLIGWTGYLLYFVFDTAVEDYVFIGDGWSLSMATVSEDFRYMSSLTHWLGEGDAYYQYADEDAEPVSEEWEAREQEPYLSAMRERSKAANIYYFYRGDTILNIIGYMYGRWYVLLYIAAMFYWSFSAILLLIRQKNRIRFGFMLVMLIPVLVPGWGVMLNAFGICYICLPPVFSHAYNYIDAFLCFWPFMIVYTAEVLCIERKESVQYVLG